MPIFCLIFKKFIKKYYILKVLKPRPCGHPFPRGASTTLPLKKDGFFSCLLKLHNLKIRESQKRALSPKLRELQNIYSNLAYKI